LIVSVIVERRREASPTEFAAREEGEALFSRLERPEVRRDADNGECVRCRRFSRASPSREVHDVVR
jgi:hypothetical protein